MKLFKYLFMILSLSESMMYQIEVITTSEDEETRIVRFNPKVLQQALDESFENKIKVRTGIITVRGPRKVKVVFIPP